jgi:methylated-DNA-[protein]-cysteine S-methyltransferase
METIYYSSFYSTWLKRIFVASTDKGICAIDFRTSEKVFLKRLKERFSGNIVRDNRKNKEVIAQLKKYLKGELKRFNGKLDLRGTSFQKKVWSALARIPYGETRSYQEVARAIGRPKAFRAVGNANGRNAIPIILPCHRVIESGGGLGGFGHGIQIKRRLLDFESRTAWK